MRGGVKLRGGRVGSRGCMVPVGVRGRRTWHERRTGQAAVRAPAQVGEGRGKGIRRRWAAWQAGRSTV
jgi:hypothetical protein